MPFFCIDIDIPRELLNEVNYRDASVKYCFLKGKISIVVKTLLEKMGIPFESILLEDTGGRGYHIWVFFSEAIKGSIVFALGELLKKHLDFEIEFFPKQGVLTARRKLGNLIKLPLGIHKKYNLRSCFLRLVSLDKLLPIDNIFGNIEYLNSIQQITTDLIENLIGATMEPIYQPHADYSETIYRSGRTQFGGGPELLISRCRAMNSLWDKAERRERFTHAEAFYFADVMLSVNEGERKIHEAMRLSLKEDYKRNYTDREIEKIAALHPPTCPSLIREGICHGYCKESVCKKNEDPLSICTTPCSVWLEKITTEPLTGIDVDNICESIGTKENFVRAFFQLKHYHEYEDALFFDPFDFEHFEKRLDENCELLARIVFLKHEIPFLGYSSVKLPKKINDSRLLEYRTMSYSTIYDQVPIQAIFNIVAPMLEQKFHQASYGYRWNADASDHYRIFQDWKEAYPRFRKSVMAALSQNPNGFHVCCDIKGFYDHIRHDILFEELRKYNLDQHVFREIERLVGAYTLSTGKNCGLPQGPAFARLLANLYLNDFDYFVSEMSVAYFRYVDDFVIVFKKKNEAVEGLEKVARRLEKLGLVLSEDEEKAAYIELNSETTHVTKTLDKIHYGVLECTRRMDYLAPSAVKDFSQAVERHSISPVTLEQIVKINDYFPSLLYIATRRSISKYIPTEKVIGIIEFLIKHKWFYPKRLKTIFYRILDMQPNEDHLRKLFRLLEPAHKVYFILSVFGCWRTQNERQELLKNLTLDSLKEVDTHVLGFAIAIADKLEIKIEVNSEYIEKINSQSKDYFCMLKWLSNLDYLNETDHERDRIRGMIKTSDPALIKNYLFTNIRKSPSTYLDSLFLRRLLQNGCILLIPAVCSLLANATDKSELFNELMKFCLSRFEYKSLIVSLINKRIHVRMDLDSFKNILYDFAEKAIIPKVEVSYCIKEKMAEVKYKTGEHLKVLCSSNFIFSQDNPESIRGAFKLSAELFRKSLYFLRHTGRIPYIKIGYIMVDEYNSTAVFRAVGKSLCSSHVIEGATFGNEETDISKMISLLLESLVFKERRVFDAFAKSRPYSGLNAFLVLFIQRMRSKDPSCRYSCSRFCYLVEQLFRKDEPYHMDNWEATIYLRERLKGVLSRLSPKMITWYGICAALNDHLSDHLFTVCGNNALYNYPFRNRLFLLGRGSGSLHMLSKYLLELALSREDISDKDEMDTAYLDLLELLLLYALVCIEIASIARVQQSKNVRHNLLSLLEKQNDIRIVAGDTAKDFKSIDIASLFIGLPENSEYEIISRLSLRLLSLKALFALCEVIVGENSIEIKKPKKMSEIVYCRLAYVCLVQIPDCESGIEAMLKDVLLALRNNEDFSRLQLDKMRNIVETLPYDLMKAKRSVRYLRYYGQADGKMFPPIIRCKRAALCGSMLDNRLMIY